MMPIKLFINLFNMLRVNALEFVSVINQKCISRPKIIEKIQINLFFIH